MNPFIREKRDGRRAPGYLVYLLAGAGVFAAVAILHRDSAPARGARDSSTRGARVSSAEQRPSMNSGTKVGKGPTAPEERSLRLSKAQRPASAQPAASSAPQAPVGSFDAIGAALAGPSPDLGREASGAEAPALDEGASAPAHGPNFAPLPPAFPTSGGRANAPSPGKDEPAQLLGYRDPSADMPSEFQAGGEPTRSGGVSLRVVPKGTLLRVYLLTTVDTGNPAAVIQFGVASDLVFNRRRQLEFGSRLLGRVSGKPVRDRVNLSADTILYPSGLELPVKASAVEADEAGCNIYPGVGARFVAPPAWVQATPYAADLFAGVMGILQSRATQQLALGTGGLSLQPSAPDRVRGAAYQASAHAVDDFAEGRLKEVEDRYAAHYLVPAGTACCLQLEADLDLAPDPPGRLSARISSDRPQAVSPANEPPPSGQAPRPAQE